MWKELLTRRSPTVSFRPAALPATVLRAQEALRLTLPADLEALLLETDGAEGEFGLSLVWPIERIVHDNLMFWHDGSFRDLYMPFDSMLFFSDAGNGDQFAFPLRSGRVLKTEVYAWNHENDSRTWVAPSLEVFFEWWLSGRLTI